MSSAPPPTPLPRPYRRFVTSRMHARFVHAALLCFIVALDTAFLVAPKLDLFWSWFPLGPAGMRAALFFMSSLFIFILQIATLTVGSPTSTSPFSRLRTCLISTAAIKTVFWYLVSAWWFSEVYIWSTPSLGWITRGGLNTPDKLNESPIYLRTFFLLLGLNQAGIHLYLGQSSIHIEVAPAPTTQTNGVSTHPNDNSDLPPVKKVLALLRRSATSTVIVTVVTPFIYAPFLRQPMWRLHLALAKPIFNLSRSNARATGFPPAAPLIPTTLLIGGLLSVTWEVSTLLFLTYLNGDPLKQGLPLSSASKDPNGTLLNGLQAKRDIFKTFAFWELAIIAQKHPDRRIAIFADIDRPIGPIWTTMLDEVLNVIKRMEIRITGPVLAPQESSVPIPTENLPRLTSEPRKAPIVAAGSKIGWNVKGVERAVAAGVQKLGTSPDPWRQPAESATLLLEYSKEAGLEASRSPLSQFVATVTTSPLGWFFKSTNRAKINVTVLGSPLGNAAIVVDAVEGATKMLVASLAEDTYGKAMGGVPETVKTFTSAINAIEQFVQERQHGVTDLGEVGIILERLKSGLRELLSAFQLYLADVGLGIGELNAAKRASEPRNLLLRPKLPQGAWGKQAGVEDASPSPSSSPDTPTRPTITDARSRRTDGAQPQLEAEKQHPPVRRQTSQRQRQPVQSTSSRRKEWNGMNGQPGSRREMEMVR